MILKKKLNINDFLFFIILNLIYLKLIFSYLMVDLGWWLRDLTPNFEAYNFFNLPQNFSRNIEYVLIPFLIIYILINFKRLGYYKIIIEISCLLLLLNLLTALHNSKGLFESIELSFKLLSPIMFYVVLVVHFETKKFDIKKTAFRFVKFCLLLTIIALVFFDPSSNRGPQRFLPIYFESIHAHTYILVCVFVIWSYSYYKKRKVKTLLLFFTLTFLFLWFGYAVRTAILVYLIYIIIVLFNVHVIFKYLWIKALVFLPIAFLIFNLLFINFDLDEYSSGRLSMYSEKIEQIKSFSFIDIFLGQGQGSDLIHSEIWAFGVKGSHSDILTYFVENGIIFTFFYFILMMYLFFIKRKANSIYLSLIIGYFVSSMISNGITTRPLVGYVFFVALAFVVLYDKSNIRYNLNEG